MVRAGLDDAAEPGAERRSPVRGDEMLAGEVLDDVLTSSSLSARSTPDAITEPSAPTRSACAGIAQPLAERARRSRVVSSLVRTTSPREEVGLDELAERAADLVLAVGDDRGVRDRDAERMPEQRRHREPVGERADHAAFGGGPHVGERGHLLLERERDGEHARAMPMSAPSATPFMTCRPRRRS